jgi:hypothetical protein
MSKFYVSLSALLWALAGVGTGAYARRPTACRSGAWYRGDLGLPGRRNDTVRDTLR